MSKVLMRVSFLDGAGVQIMEGDPADHAHKCHHTTVEVFNRDNLVEDAWLFEHTNPMNELESWQKFCRVAIDMARTRGVSIGLAVFSEPV